VPYNVEKLNGVGICQIECGAQVHTTMIQCDQMSTWKNGPKFSPKHFCQTSTNIFCENCTPNFRATYFSN
jgi:hypothetical protein